MPRFQRSIWSALLSLCLGVFGAPVWAQAGPSGSPAVENKQTAGKPSEAKPGETTAASVEAGPAESRRVDVKTAHKTACAAAYESAQEARLGNHLLEAKKHLTICAQSQCPAFIRADCAQWFEQVDDEIPAVVVSALDANGDEATEVKVYVDGKLAAEHLDGTPLELDPGEHTFRFEHENDPPLQQTTLILAGEKTRKIEASWYSGKPNQGGAQVQASPGPLRPYAYVLGGIAGAGLISFGVFGIVGRQQEKQVKEKCNADLVNCPLNEIDAAERKQRIADISLAVAAVTGIAGATLFILSEPKEGAAGPQVKVDLGMSPAGAMARVRGSF
ncbi:MAG TPA: hypothetical protein VL137_03915 [Polyangiaceae bacterium]|nr:hypothetical protein [Polyangiaceae bacterium]